MDSEFTVLPQISDIERDLFKTYVVEYAMGPYWNKRLITGNGVFLHGFLSSEDVIYSIKEWTND